MPGLSLVWSLAIPLVLRAIRFMIWLLQPILSLEMLFLKNPFFFSNIGFHVLSLFLFLLHLLCSFLNLSYQILVLLFPLQNLLLHSPQIQLFLLMSFLTLSTLILTPLIHLVIFLSLHLLFNLLGSLLELGNHLAILKTIIATWLLHMCFPQFHFLNQMIPLLLVIQVFFTLLLQLFHIPIFLLLINLLPLP